jgi:hypothetical protein
MRDLTRQEIQEWQGKIVRTAYGDMGGGEESPEARIFTDVTEARDHKTYLKKYLKKHNLFYGEYTFFENCTWVYAHLYDHEANLHTIIEIKKRI